MLRKKNLRQYADCFVQSYGWFESIDAVYIAMEYIEHGDLQKYLIAPFPESEVRVIVSQLADGLEFMHNNGFTHRDIKPAVCSPSPPVDLLLLTGCMS